MLIFLTMLETTEEQELFSKIYNKYKYFMWYIANEILQDLQLSEDAVQEACIALTRHMDKVQEADSPRTKKFLATIAKSKAIDIIRRRNKQAVSLAGEEFPDESGEDLLDQIIAAEDYQHVLASVKSLDQKYRVVFEYKYLHQLSDKEIAGLLEISPKAVNVRIYRARKKLQECLKEEVIKRGK